MQPEYAIVVKNKTRLETLIERFSTRAQAKFYIERMGGHFEDYEAEHQQFYDALSALQTRLSGVLKNKLIERAFLPSFLFSEQHMVVVIGQDGLVANTAKYAKGQPILAVNPDPARYDGVLLPFQIQNFMSGVERVMNGAFSTRNVRLAEARLNDGQRLLAFNDLFIGAATHTSARYRISWQQRTEEQSSSGMIVSTAAGATGWMSSVFNMACGVAGMMGQSLDLRRPALHDHELIFAVREPFQSLRTQTGITAGRINTDSALSVESLMPAGGVIFSDGIESDFLHFNSGTTATIAPAPEQAILVTQ